MVRTSRRSTSWTCRCPNHLRRAPAVSLLNDLSALARREGEQDSFTSRFLELRARHERKPSLQERFDKAGLPRASGDPHQCLAVAAHGDVTTHDDSLVLVPSGH